MFKKVFFIILSLFISSISFSQTVNQKKINKLKKKGYSIRGFKNNYSVVYNKKRSYGVIDTNGKMIIKPKYTYLSDVSKEGNLITGEYVYGASDGGGAPKKGLKNFKVLTLKGDVVKEKEFVKMKVEFFPNVSKQINDSYYKVWNTEKIGGGIINTNGDYIIKPEYTNISTFNKKGQVLVFKNNLMFVFNTQGKQLNKESLYYNKKDHAPTQTTLPYKHRNSTNTLKVIKGKLISSNQKGNKYGIFDLDKNEMLIPFKYDKISPHLFVKEKDTIGYKVYNNNLSALIDYKTKKEIIPFVFEEITDYISFKKDTYIEGYKKDEKLNGRVHTLLTNYIDINTKKLVFPTNIRINEGIPVNSEYWIVKINGLIDQPNGTKLFSKAYSVFNVKQQKYIETPKMGYYSSLKRLSDHLVMFNKKNSESRIYDLIKGKTVKTFDREPYLTSFTLTSNEIIKSFIIISKNGSKTLYDENMDIVFKDRKYFTAYIEKDRYIIKESINGKYVKTAYGVDGKVIK